MRVKINNRKFNISRYWFAKLTMRKALEKAILSYISFRRDNNFLLRKLLNDIDIPRDNKYTWDIKR